MAHKCLVAFWLIALLLYSTAYGQGTPFYQDKTIRIVAGSTTGGTYDRWARMFARTMPKYIPGNPSMLVQNMPGAGSMVAANYLYAVAKPDGLTIGMFQNNLYLDELVGRKEAQFKMVNFNWVGTQEKDPMIQYIRADSSYKFIEAIIKAKEPPKCSNSATTELLAEAKKAQLDVDPTSGEDLQVLIKDLMNQTGPVIERVKNLLR